MNLKKLLISLGLPLAVGGLSALLSGGMGDYDTLVKPPLSPPGWLFPVVWTILFLLMGYAAYRIWTADAPQADKRRALVFYGVQLALNFLWSPVFFGLELRLAAFIVLLLLWFLVCLTLHAFSALDDRAGDLLIPYILWVTFAGYLNLGAYLLN